MKQGYMKKGLVASCCPVVRPGAPLVASLLLVAMPGAPSSFWLLVAMHLLLVEMGLMSGFQRALDIRKEAKGIACFMTCLSKLMDLRRRPIKFLSTGS